MGHKKSRHDEVQSTRMTWCCFWNNVKSGTLATGIHCIFCCGVRVVMIYLGGLFFQAAFESSNPPENPPVWTDYVIGGLIAFDGLLLLFSLVLIAGNALDVRFLLVPWLGLTTTYLAIDIAYLIYQLYLLIHHNLVQRYTRGEKDHVLTTVVIAYLMAFTERTAFNIYGWICTYHRYKNLRDDARKKIKHKDKYKQMYSNGTLLSSSNQIDTEVDEKTNTDSNNNLKVPNGQTVIFTVTPPNDHNLSQHNSNGLSRSTNANQIKNNSQELEKAKRTEKFNRVHSDHENQQTSPSSSRGHPSGSSASQVVDKPDENRFVIPIIRKLSDFDHYDDNDIETFKNKSHKFSNENQMYPPIRSYYDPNLENIRQSLRNHKPVHAQRGTHPDHELQLIPERHTGDRRFGELQRLPTVPLNQAYHTQYPYYRSQPDGGSRTPSTSNQPPFTPHRLHSAHSYVYKNRAFLHSSNDFRNDIEQFDQDKCFRSNNNGYNYNNASYERSRDAYELDPWI